MKQLYAAVLVLSMICSQPVAAQNDMQISDAYYTARNTVSVVSSLLLARAFTKERYSKVDKGVVALNAFLMAYFLFHECLLRAENSK